MLDQYRVSTDAPSGITHEDDPQRSTMRRFIEALCGQLIVQARIGDEVIDLLP